MTRAVKRVFQRRGVFTVYMLLCCGGSLYTGYANDLAARLKLHRSGKGSKYVRARRPFKLVYTKQYRYYKRAVAEERRIKLLSRGMKDKLLANYSKGSKKQKQRRNNVSD